MNDDEGEGVLNWSPRCGVNKTLAKMFTTVAFECPISLEASYVFLVLFLSLSQL